MMGRSSGFETEDLADPVGHGFPCVAGRGPARRNRGKAMLKYYPDGHEPKLVLDASVAVPALQEAIVPTIDAVRNYLSGSRFDGDPLFAEDRSHDLLRVILAVDKTRALLQSWRGHHARGFGLDHSLRGLKRAVRMFLPTAENGEPLSDGDFREQFGDSALATEDTLRELMEIIEDLGTWNRQGVPQDGTAANKPEEPLGSGADEPNSPSYILPDDIGGLRALLAQVNAEIRRSASIENDPRLKAELAKSPIPTAFADLTALENLRRAIIRKISDPATPDEVDRDPLPDEGRPLSLGGLHRLVHDCDRLDQLAGPNEVFGQLADTPEKMKRLNAYHRRQYAIVFAPGFDDLKSYCHIELGQHVTCETVDRICFLLTRKLRKPLETIRQLTIVEAMKSLQEPAAQTEAAVPRPEPTDRIAERGDTSGTSVASREADLTPPARAIAAAYDLQREEKPVSLRAACERAKVDRANLRKRYPEAVKTIEALSLSQVKPRRGATDRRTGTVHALDDAPGE
jgi:hypothetical protein